MVFALQENLVQSAGQGPDRLSLLLGMIAITLLFCSVLCFVLLARKGQEGKRLRAQLTTTERLLTEMQQELSELKLKPLLQQRVLEDMVGHAEAMLEKAQQTAEVVVENARQEALAMLTETLQVKRQKEALRARAQVRSSKNQKHRDLLEKGAVQLRFSGEKTKMPAASQESHARRTQAKASLRACRKTPHLRLLPKEPRSAQGSGAKTSRQLSSNAFQ